MSDKDQSHNSGVSDDIGRPAEANEAKSSLPEPTREAGSSSKSAKKITLVVTALLALLVVMYALTDRLAPSSSRGVVSAHVAQIAPRVTGQITQVLVEDNAVVEAGDPLFAIDQRPFQLALQQAKANLETATQNISASSASLVAAQAVVTQSRVALDNARAKADRVQRLEQRGVISTAEADDARSKLADAKAKLDSAQANLQSSRAQLGSKGKDNPAILAAESKLEQAQYDLASTTVKAPHFGVITNVTLSEGQFISAGNPAMTFIDARAAWVTVDLRENQLQNLDQGDAARVLFDAVPGKIYEGRVQSIAWGINPGRKTQEGLVVSQPNNRWFEPARRIPVRIELAGGMQNWPSQVRVGGKVDVTVLTSGSGNPIAWIARGVQRLQSWASYLH